MVVKVVRPNELEDIYDDGTIKTASIDWKPVFHDAKHAILIVVRYTLK